MDDQLYQMIKRDIELILDDSDGAIEVNVEEQNSGCSNDSETFDVFNVYKSHEMAAEEGLLLNQYVKWSTVESDELAPNQRVKQRTEQRTDILAYAAVMNLNVEIIKNYIALCYPMTKRSCSFCKKNGMNSAIYSSHWLRVNGVQTCPYLKNSQCLICFQYGHTNGYCPLKKCIATNNHLTQKIAPMLFSRSNAVERY